jgi:hypothetical protein
MSDKDLDRIYQKLDSIETKMDGFLADIVAIKVRIAQINGFIRVGLTAFLAAIGYLARELWIHLIAK